MQKHTDILKRIEYERRLGARIIAKLQGMLQTRSKAVLKTPEGFNPQFEDLICHAGGQLPHHRK